MVVRLGDCSGVGNGVGDGAPVIDPHGRMPISQRRSSPSSTLATLRSCETALGMAEERRVGLPEGEGGLGFCCFGSLGRTDPSRLDFSGEASSIGDLIKESAQLLSEKLVLLLFCCFFFRVFLLCCCQALYSEESTNNVFTVRSIIKPNKLLNPINPVIRKRLDINCI